jgi:hypothetical protein
MAHTDPISQALATAKSDRVELPFLLIGGRQSRSAGGYLPRPPSPTQVQRLPDRLPCTWLDLLWASIVVGKRNLEAVVAFGPHSEAEVQLRIGVIDAYLRAQPPTTSHGHAHPLGRMLVVPSPLYDDADPSEKAAASYRVGMTVAQLVAWQRFGIPFLEHVSHAARPGSSLPGWFPPAQNWPDLVAHRDGPGDWWLVEAKGKQSVSRHDLDKAYAQLTRSSLRRVAPPPDVCMFTATGLTRCLYSLAVVLGTPPPADPPTWRALLLADPASRDQLLLGVLLVYRILEYHRRTTPDQVRRLRVALTNREADLRRSWIPRAGPTDPPPGQPRDVDAVTLTGTGLTLGLETALYIEVRERLPDLAAQLAGGEERPLPDQVIDPQADTEPQPGDEPPEEQSLLTEHGLYLRTDTRWRNLTRLREPTQTTG